MLVNLNDILPRARKNGYAVGAFNTSNLELTQAIVKTAQTLYSPVIIAVSEKALIYAGINLISRMVISMAEANSIPVVLHLDHGRSFEIAKKCINHGFSSVMIDTSHLKYRENVRTTQQVVRYAHKHDVSVEAEIGRLAGVEDDINVKKKHALYTQPKEAARFVKESGCDALAIAIGTSHGAYKFHARPRLRIDILNDIAAQVKIPLVLHGASSVQTKWINRVNRYGGTLEKTKGVPDRLIKEAVAHGISKINTDTDLRIAFTAGVRQYLWKHTRDFDPRAILGHARISIEQIVEDRIRIFGSKGRA